MAGVTLIELMLVLVVLVLLYAYALPGFASLVERSQVVSQQHRLHGALNLARSHALATGAATVVCPLRAGSHEVQPECDLPSGDWSHGWMIFEDPRATNACTVRQPETICDPGEGRVVRLYEPVANGYRVVSNRNVSRRVRFNGLGMSPGYTGRFAFCSGGGKADPVGLVVPQTGRIRRARSREMLPCPVSGNH